MVKQVGDKLYYDPRQRMSDIPNWEDRIDEEVQCRGWESDLWHPYTYFHRGR